MTIYDEIRAALAEATPGPWSMALLLEAADQMAELLDKAIGMEEREAAAMDKYEAWLSEVETARAAYRQKEGGE